MCCIASDCKNVNVVNDISISLNVSKMTDKIILGPNVVFSYPCININKKISKFPQLKEKILLEENICNQKYDTILICNDDLLNLYETRMKYYNRIISFPYGVNTELFKPNNNIDRIFITSIVPSNQKGLALLTKAKKLLPLELQSKWTFYDNDNKYEHGSKRHIEILQTTKIFVSGSAYETQGLATFEALSCGCPIIICSYTYKKDNDDKISTLDPIYFNKSMSIITERDPKQISESIINLYNNTDMVKEMSKNSRNYIVNNFSLETMSKQYDRIIDMS